MGMKKPGRNRAWVGSRPILCGHGVPELQLNRVPREVRNPVGTPA